MTNLAHWQDDIDEALGGDFDGSLSGLCIMSLSFDFSRNRSQLGAGREAPISAPMADNTNCFKRFKPSISANDLQPASQERNDIQADQQHEESRSGDDMRVPRQLQTLKGSLNGVQSSSNSFAANAQQLPADEALSVAPLSPDPSESSCARESANSTPDDSSSSSTAGARSPSPNQSCSSISTHSRASSRSRSRSPPDMSLHSIHNQANQTAASAKTSSDLKGVASALRSSAKNNSAGQPDGRNANQSDGQQVSIYSVRDNLLNGSSLKESSYTTSVITTTAPMHFKSIHHPFSLKQFPLSPYHQFSNSSLNHDFYDRYLSHDGHQPLQTPLIGIERTQDLLSLKLPPHGPTEDTDSQRFSKDWPFDETKQEAGQASARAAGAADNAQEPKQQLMRLTSPTNDQRTSGAGDPTKRKLSAELPKGFPFNYKSNSSTSKTSERQREPIDLNVAYEQDASFCNNSSSKNKDNNASNSSSANNNHSSLNLNPDKHSIFEESMRHFNPDRVGQSNCFDSRAKSGDSLSQSSEQPGEAENVACAAYQYHAQESMFGLDTNKQSKFQYVLNAPISVATKLTEDTMTYLNQGQAYEIRLENMTDVSEAKKGFISSIINIGFHERHMQQAEGELWQQWSQQHPNEKIFSVDMKLSYNVFGVESDCLNKYKFLWDSSKAAGVFIRMNSISTEFTPKKHGGEKGVPFKLSIETSLYNSKTHESYFISAACCQIKVFKPKGAERKIRSDRDKIFKRPPSEQEKFHRSCDHTTFRDCSLGSIHPISADGCYYRYNHSLKLNASASIASTSPVHSQPTNAQQTDEELEHPNTVNAQQDNSPDIQPASQTSNSQANNEADNSSSGHQSSQQRDNYSDSGARSMLPATKAHPAEYSSGRLMHNHYPRSNLDVGEHSQHNYGPQTGHQPTSESSAFSQSTELVPFGQPTGLNQMYHSGQVRGLAATNNSHLGMTYYGHSIPAHLTPSSSYPTPTSMSMNQSGHNHHSSALSAQHQVGARSGSSIYRPPNLDKLPTVSQASHVTSFKASNLALSSHNNYPNYQSNQPDQCSDHPASQDLKDSSLNCGTYLTESYESHPSHPIHFAGAHNQPTMALRQRSASTSFASTGSQYAGYATQANQSRNLDTFVGPNATVHDTAHQNHNHWTSSTSNQQMGSSPSLSCTQRSNTNLIPQNQNNSAYSNASNTHNYECNNHNYDSDQHSPQKNNHHTNDSSSSCCSRYKNTSSLISYTGQQSLFESPKMNSQVSIHLTASSTCLEVANWFPANRFGLFAKTFNNFSGSDLLRLSKTELIEICGLIDGIRLYNCLHNQPIKPKRVLYVCQKASEVFHPIYLYDVNLRELLRELSLVLSSSTPKNERNPLEEKQKNSADKSLQNSTASTDSRSSIGAMSSETGAEDVYNQVDHFLNHMEVPRKYPPSNFKQSDMSVPPRLNIDRLLIDGITPVKILATEQVIQILEDESVWTLSLSSSTSGLVEACLSACRSKRSSK